MSNRIFISPGVSVIPQADFTATRPTDNGAWEATQSYMIVKGSLDQPAVNNYFAIGRPIKDLYPQIDDIWTFLRVRDLALTTMDGGWQRATVTYGGFPAVDQSGNPISSPDEFAVTYQLNGQVSDDTLANHPKWKALSDTEQSWLGRLMSGELIYAEDPFDPGNYAIGRPGEITAIVSPNPITSNNGKEFALRIMQGISTYRRAGYTWSKRWDASAPITAAQLNLVGKIVANPPGDPPSPQNRDWLLTAANIDQRGEEGAQGTVYNNELVFELSEQEGWDEFLYGTS